ncbi:MAG TPA: glutamyl-tRNA reductase [Candidatus Dormibacteraeota bacterium]|nr:glutamyl-tRNA reductase [Candidatus Dormibacteraeota bacterium]
MPIVCLGLSHNTAPVEVRERHAFPASRMAEALTALRDYGAVKEAAMLQTCGRLEIYAELDDYEAGVVQLKSFLGNFGHGSARTRYDLDSYMYTLLGRQAVEHLFRVATGLDSMLIGEAEILGQVKDAYIAAHQAKALGKSLHRLFREALNAGKTARSQTHIGDESVSIATAAIEAAKARLGSLDSRSVVVIGAGKMGRTAVKRLRQEGATHLIVTNRTMSRAQDLIAEVGFGEAVEMPGLVEALSSADIVVTSTGASHFVLTRENITAAMAARPERPLFIIDIAVPRDAEPSVVEIPNVTMVDIDGLKSVVDRNLDTRRESIPDVEEIIESYIERFDEWYRARVAVPIISSLTRKAEAIRESEVARLFARCPELTEREKMLVAGMSMTIVSKLLHSAVTRIRATASRNHSEAISHARVLDELFELDLADHIAHLLPASAAIDTDE